MACLMISHRLAAVRSCAEICVLQHGRIVERGTHEHLMEKRGAYWNLCTRQYGAGGACADPLISERLALSLLP